MYHGTYEPIISRELREEVQAILDGRGTKKTRNMKEQFAFSGLITCGHCGCAMVGEIKKGRYLYYHCTFKGKCPEPEISDPGQNFPTQPNRHAERLFAFGVANGERANERCALASSLQHQTQK